MLNERGHNSPQTLGEIEFLGRVWEEDGLYSERMGKIEERAAQAKGQYVHEWQNYSKCVQEIKSVGKKYRRLGRTRFLRMVYGMVKELGCYRY